MASNYSDRVADFFHQRKYTEQKVEIERLRESERDLLDAVDNRNDLLADADDYIEELEGTNKVLGQWVEDKDRHIERLRAALDRIANNIDECDGLHMKEIACKALSARYKEDE